MGEVPFRERREKEISQAVNGVFRKFRNAKHNRQPAYARIRKALLSRLIPIFNKLRRQTVRFFLRSHAPELKPSDLEMPSAKQHAEELVEQLIETTKESWIQAGKRKTRETVLKWRDKMLGKKRADRIAITEVTYNHQAAQDAAWSQVQRKTGKSLQAFWRAQIGHCEVCRVVDGKPSSFWRALHPYGPPAHPNCRCSIHFSKMQVSPPRGVF